MPAEWAGETMSRCRKYAAAHGKDRSFSAKINLVVMRYAEKNDRQDNEQDNGRNEIGNKQLDVQHR